jgi:hypothetical protein
MQPGANLVRSPCSGAAALLVRCEPPCHLGEPPGHLGEGEPGHLGEPDHLGEPGQLREPGALALLIPLPARQGAGQAQGQGHDTEQRGGAQQAQQAQHAQLPGVTSLLRVQVVWAGVEGAVHAEGAAPGTCAVPSCDRGESGLAISGEVTGAPNCAGDRHKGWAVLGLAAWMLALWAGRAILVSRLCV